MKSFDINKIAQKFIWVPDNSFENFVMFMDEELFNNNWIQSKSMTDNTLLCHTEVEIFPTFREYTDNLDNFIEKYCELKSNFKYKLYTEELFREKIPRIVFKITKAENKVEKTNSKKEEITNFFNNLERRMEKN